MLTLTVLVCSLLITGCSTTGSFSNTTKGWGKCAVTGGAIWGIPGAVHGLATGGVSMAAGAIVSGVACATASQDAANSSSDVLPAHGREGTTVARFTINSALLNDTSNTALDTFLEGRMYSNFTIIGHTCDLGSKDFNQNLSEKRANAVKKYLLKKGITPGQISVKGEGEKKPLLPNSSESNRKKNRRVEIVLVD